MQLLLKLSATTSLKVAYICDCKRVCFSVRRAARQPAFYEKQKSAFVRQAAA